LFNIQQYWAKNTPVHAHRDGEVFEARLTHGPPEVIRALYPKKVALLTLKNNAIGGGTHLHFLKNRQGQEHSECVVTAQSGDLLIFDNVTNEHGVDLLLPSNEKEGEIIRQIIGWRSLEENCVYFNGRRLRESLKDVSYAKACSLQEHFFSTIWPHKKKRSYFIGSQYVFKDTAMNSWQPQASYP